MAQSKKGLVENYVVARIEGVLDKLGNNFLPDKACKLVKCTICP